MASIYVNLFDAGVVKIFAGAGAGVVQIKAKVTFQDNIAGLISATSTAMAKYCGRS